MSEQHAKHPDRQNPGLQAASAQKPSPLPQLVQVASESDRLWLAFQYITDELSDDDTEAFEVAMLEDVKLCEAVAQATSLLATLNLSCKEWHQQKFATVDAAASTIIPYKHSASENDLQVIAGNNTPDTQPTLIRPVMRTWRTALAMGLPVAASVAVLFVVSQAGWLQDAGLQDSSFHGTSDTPQVSVLDIPSLATPNDHDNVKAAEWLLSIYALGDSASDADRTGFDQRDARIPAANQSTEEDLLADAGWLTISDDRMLLDKGAEKLNNSPADPAFATEESYPGDEVIVPEWLMAAIQLDQHAAGADSDSRLEFHEENSDVF